MIELMHTYWCKDDEIHKDLDKLLELHKKEITDICKNCENYEYYKNGYVEIRNNHPWLYVYDTSGELHNSFELKNNIVLDLIIKNLDNDDYEQKYKRLLIGETIKGNKHTIYELMFIMNGE